MATSWQRRASAAFRSGGALMCLRPRTTANGDVPGSHFGATGDVASVQSVVYGRSLSAHPLLDSGGVGPPAAPEVATLLALGFALELALMDGLLQLNGLRGAKAEAKLVDGEFHTERLMLRFVHGRCPSKRCAWGDLRCKG